MIKKPFALNRTLIIAIGLLVPALCLFVVATAKNVEEATHPISTHLFGDGAEARPVYDEHGHLLYYSELIKLKAIPSNITSQIEFNYPDWKMTNDNEAIRYDLDRPIDHYILRLKNGKETMELKFSTQGRLIQDN